MLPLKPPYNILHFINILLSPNICIFWDMETFLHFHPIFLHFQIWPFWPQKHKHSNLTNSFLAYYPQPKKTKRAKDPKSILILTMKLLYTYFWKWLPLGALIWLTPIWLIWAQITQPTSNHLKIALWRSWWFEKCPKISTPPNLNFLTEGTQKFKLFLSFLVHYPQPKLNYRSPKVPKLTLILTMKQVYICFW